MIDGVSGVLGWNRKQAIKALDGKVGHCRLDGHSSNIAVMSKISDGI
jgi:hypothetical protein